MGKASRAKQTRADRIANAGYKEKPFNWFPLITTVAVIAVVGLVAALTFLGNKQAGEPSVAPKSNITVPADISTSIEQETGAVVIGDAEDVLEEYVDFGCPFCGDYYRTNGEQIKQFVADGALTLKIVPLGMLDNAFQGTEFSTRSANALYCVAENNPNSILDFVANMYENQPREGTKGLDDDELVRIAELSEATDSESCIREVGYDGFVAEKTKLAMAQPWFQGTPALRLNGNVVDANAAVDAVRNQLEATASGKAGE